MEHPSGYRIPAGEGRSRSVLVRPSDRGIVQLAILSVYGNILESVDLDAELQGAIAAGLVWAREDTDRRTLARLAAEHLAAAARRQEGPARRRRAGGGVGS